MYEIGFGGSQIWLCLSPILADFPRGMAEIAYLTNHTVFSLLYIVQWCWSSNELQMIEDYFIWCNVWSGAKSHAKSRVHAIIVQACALQSAVFNINSYKFCKSLMRFKRKQMMVPVLWYHAKSTRLWVWVPPTWYFAASSESGVWWPDMLSQGRSIIFFSFTILNSGINLSHQPIILFDWNSLNLHVLPGRSVLAVESNKLFLQPGGNGMSSIVPKRRSLLSEQEVMPLCGNQHEDQVAQQVSQSNWNACC